MPDRSRKPWWAAAMAGGFGAVLGVAYLIAQPAQGREPRVTSSTVVQVQREPGSLSLDERLEKIETTLDTLKDQVSDLRRRIPAKAKTE